MIQDCGQRTKAPDASPLWITEIDGLYQFAMLQVKVEDRPLLGPIKLISKPSYMPTLLEKALSVPKPQPVLNITLTDEHIELIFAYLSGVITTRQASVALGGKSPGNFTHWLSKALVELYRSKKIKIEPN